MVASFVKNKGICTRYQNLNMVMDKNNDQWNDVQDNARDNKLMVTCNKYRIKVMRLSFWSQCHPCSYTRLDSPGRFLLNSVHRISRSVTNCALSCAGRDLQHTEGASPRIRRRALDLQPCSRPIKPCRSRGRSCARTGRVTDSAFKLRTVWIRKHASIALPSPSVLCWRHFDGSF